MPITPFHVGPALVVRALGPRWFSLGVFSLVQVAIDVESVVNVILGRYPIQATLHTVAAGVAALPARAWRLVAAAATLPRRALTRGQMAVFLSLGLGLHFAP